MPPTANPARPTRIKKDPRRSINVEIPGAASRASRHRRPLLLRSISTNLARVSRSASCGSFNRYLVLNNVPGAISPDFSRSLVMTRVLGPSPKPSPAPSGMRVIMSASMNVVVPSLNVSPISSAKRSAIRRSISAGG